MKKQLLCLGAILLMVQGASAFYLGVAPGTNDMGTLERGETYQKNIYIQTNYDGELELDPSVARPSVNYLNTLSSSDESDFAKDEYSEESIDSWINFQEVQYEEGDIELDSGVRATVDGKLDYFLEVPRNAEPGYHVAKVSLNPKYGSGGSGTTVSTVAISEHYIVFRVPGEARRDIEVSEVRGLRDSDSSVEMRLKVENTGTVTTALRPTENPILTDSGQDISEYFIGGTYLEPGETRTLKGGWSMDEDVTAGNYRTRGQLNYMTGKAFFDSSFSITDYIQIEQADNDTSGQLIPSGGSQDSPPLMFIVIGLVLTGSLLYAFEIDPLLIILALGMFAISSIVWFTAIPTSAIALVVLLSAGLFYYGWM